eukprot:9097069-Heterocapsa_arctica.AAC.1
MGCRPRHWTIPVVDLRVALSAAWSESTETRMHFGMACCSYLMARDGLPLRYSAPSASSPPSNF